MLCGRARTGESEAVPQVKAAYEELYELSRPPRPHGGIPWVWGTEYGRLDAVMFAPQP